MNRVIRSTVNAAAERIAASERLSNILYGVMNETNFAGIAEHEEMLNDSIRVDTYHRGIHRQVQPGDVVVDLGTGTGLLAFIASRAGAKKVYAIEHSGFIDVARELAAANGITNIEFVHANSREWVAPEPIDVIIHEQMGDELFNENLLHSLLDARDRFLTPGGRLLPGTFRLFAEPVSFHPAMRIRRLWNIDLPDNIDLSSVQHSLTAARYESAHNDVFWARPGSVEQLIGTHASPIIEVNLATITSIESLPLSYMIDRTATSDMIIDGLCIWFEAEFDNETVLTTSPLAPLTSWGNRIFRLDRDLTAGERLRLHLHMGQLEQPDTWQIETL